MNLATLPRAAMLAAVGLVAWLLLVILPLSSAAANAEAAARTAQKQFDEATHLVQKLEDAKSQPMLSPPTQGLLLTVKSDIAAAGIPDDDVHGLQDVSGSVRVDFMQVPGDLLVRFLYRLQTQGLVLQQWDMSAVQQPGVWTVSGLVAQP